jgi:hypothetical protein
MSTAPIPDPELDALIAEEDAIARERTGAKPAFQPRTLAQVAHSLDVTTPRAIETVEQAIERIRRLADIMRTKVDDILAACAVLDTDADRCLSYLISIANHAGYSNTISCNVAELLAECGRVDATIDAWVRSQG